MVNSSSLAHPGVRFPPPLLYLAGLLAGFGLNRWQPLPLMAGGLLWREVAATVCFVAWVALSFGAFAIFRRSRTSIIPNRPATALVTAGPYRFTRNPMYLSLVVLYVGVTLLTNSWWPLVLLPVVVLAVDRLVIAREERYLADAFPTDYAAYRARVRRWL